MALTAVVVALGVLGSRGGTVWRAQKRRFVCPERGAPVECEIVQNVRTGRYADVRWCTAFAPDEPLACARECRRVMNAGFRLSGARPT
jgi:hypothetical protein